MKCDKARDLFSDFYEGHLARGLAEALKGHLAECYDCQEDYRGFTAVFASLGDLPPIQPPEDLGKSISRRLDEVVWRQKEAAKPRIGVLRWALAAAGVGALTGLSVLGYNRWQGSEVPAGTLPRANLEPSAHVRVEDGSVRLSYRPTKATRVSVMDATDSRLLHEVELQPGQQMSTPIEVLSDESRVIRVRIDDKTEFLVVLPGRRPAEDIGRFDGRLLDALRLLSDRFGCVIEAHIPQSLAELAVSVDFTGQRLSQGLDTLLAGAGYKAGYKNGVVRIVSE